MFNQLDECINEYGEDTALMSEYWHDDGIEDATEILDQFQSEDWDLLNSSLSTKSALWKRRLSYCLTDDDNEEHLKTLQSIVDTDDLLLFNVSLSILNHFDGISDECDHLIRQKIEQFMPQADDSARTVYDYYLKKKDRAKKDLKIFTDNIERSARDQIDRLLEQEAFKNSKVRIMPDVHKGKDCVIGFTADLGDKVIPSIVGGDIGCGMFCADLGQIDIDYQKLDQFIHDHVPSGMDLNQDAIDFDFEQLLCFKRLKNMSGLQQSLGTLGGGNHFIEIDESKDGNKYLVIHTGSRNLGAQVARIYQDLANQICNGGILRMKKEIDATVAEYKSTGRTQELGSALQEIKERYKNQTGTVPSEFAYLEGKYRDAYLHDMQICQKFAEMNRYSIAKKIADYMGWDISNYFESVHNYISLEDNIVRKGAISAKEGEPVIIPMNMRDGCIIGIGKGNSDWNHSAPHGAGRIMSRKEATEKVDMEEYRQAMEGIFSTSITEDTVDESPFAYKPADEIQSLIGPTVVITEVVKPKYNFKASGTRMFKEQEESLTDEVVK